MRAREIDLIACYELFPQISIYTGCWYTRHGRIVNSTLSLHQISEKHVQRRCIWENHLIKSTRAYTIFEAEIFFLNFHMISRQENILTLRPRIVNVIVG